MPVESRLELDGSGRKALALPAGSSFFLCSLWKHDRMV